MKNEKIIFAACSEVKTESSGTWFETFPAYGRYAVGGIIKGADPKAEFIFDEAAAKEIITNFREAMAKADWPGVLVDREHFSADREKTSDAMAWAKDIRQETDGSIWTKWEFTAPGRELWEGKVLISRSPLFACTREGINFRPFRLESIGMTNTPHFKELSTLAAAKASENKEKENMDKILEALGLEEGSNEEAVLGAIQALKDKATAAEAKATEAETAKTEAEKAKEEAVAECKAMKADKFIEANKEKIVDVAAAKAAYIENPALAEKIFASCKAAPASTQQILAAAKTKAPGSKESDVMTRLAACKSAEERCAFVMAHAKEIADAAK